MDDDIEIVSKIDFPTLEHRGYVVVRLFNIQNSQLVTSILNEQQEFIDKRLPLSAGGFGAFGNTSSFHCEGIRHLRLIIGQILKPEFKKYYNGRNIEVLIDRFSYRYPETSTTPESWHRDIGPNSGNDIIYGGWLNMDHDRNQYFSAIPETHRTASDISGHGFAKFSKEESRQYNAKRQEKGIPIPPGHLLIFNQDLIHEVLVTKTKMHSARLYCGWRVTNSKIPLHGEAYFLNVVNNQANPLLPSGQEVPMYPKLWAVNWLDKLAEYSSNVKPVYLDERGRVQRFMMSLRDAIDIPGSGIHMFPAYSEEEIKLLRPN
jgi:hypothetical protein